MGFVMQADVNGISYPIAMETRKPVSNGCEQ